MEQIRLTFAAERNIAVLSSESQIRKTERFVKETRRIKGVDLMLSLLCGGVFSVFERLNALFLHPEQYAHSCFRLQTADKEHVFFIKFGCQLKIAGERDIIFFKYAGRDSENRRNDHRFVNYLKDNPQIELVLLSERDFANPHDFVKLYNPSYADGVNFPLLSGIQSEIINTEDKNVLVRGVAGSGKTNICIGRIVNAACRGYAGRVLYTTYSRGLLLDTRAKINAYRDNLSEMLRLLSQDSVIFCDKNQKKAIENRLSIRFDVEGGQNIIDKLGAIISYLDNKVDYFLIEDMYREYVGAERAVGERYFVEEYLNTVKNHRLTGRLNKLSGLPYEVIYKEIFGMIAGSYDINNPKPMLTAAEYYLIREDSFTVPECEVIYSLAEDYLRHLAQNGLTDNNLMSRALLTLADDLPQYSLAVIDEVQDMTEVSLCLFKRIALKLFAVGDALQMINPSCFSFAYLKRLMFERDVVTVAELTNNYRNSQKITDIIDRLGDINKERFGTHSFVLKGESVESPPATASYIGGSFTQKLASEALDDLTVVVSGLKEKEALRAILPKLEILTVSEVKGLERDTVVLFNLLSDHWDKWEALDRVRVNRKTADENSVYRYYFNLFYVGVSRAKTALYVAEENPPKAFIRFFSDNFDAKSPDKAFEELAKLAGKADDAEELTERTMQFVTLGQYDNARHAAARLTDDAQRIRLNNIIDVTEKFIAHGAYREAGIEYWQRGMTEEAREMFGLSKDSALTALMEACVAESGGTLGIDVVQFFAEVGQSDIAQKLILQTVKGDLNDLKSIQTALNNSFKLAKQRNRK